MTLNVLALEQGHIFIALSTPPQNLFLVIDSLHSSTYFTLLIKIAHPGVRTLVRQVLLCVLLANSSITKITQQFRLLGTPLLETITRASREPSQKNKLRLFARKLGHPLLIYSDCCCKPFIASMQPENMSGNKFYTRTGSQIFILTGCFFGDKIVLFNKTGSRSAGQAMLHPYDK